MNEDEQEAIEQLGASKDGPSTEVITIEWAGIEYQVVVDVTRDYSADDELADILAAAAHGTANNINEWSGVLATVRTVEYDYHEEEPDERHQLEFDPEGNSDD